MDRVGLLTVQVSSVHHRLADRGGGWGIAVLVSGLLLVSAGMMPMVRLRRWRSAALSARGRVIDYVPQLARGRREAWLPVIEFEADGQTVMFSGQDAHGRRGWAVGQAVDVLYDAADPRRAGVADSGLALSWTLIVGIGVLGLFVAQVST